MKALKRMIALLLAMSMLFAFVGCTGDPAADPQPSTEPTEPPTEPTEPPVDWVGMYTDALAKLEGHTSMTLNVEEETTTTLAGKSFPSATEYIAKYQGLGTDNLLARMEGVYTSGEYTYGLNAHYAEGMLYISTDDAKFSSSMEQDVFLESFYPAALFDPENYEVITGDKNDLSTIHFSDPIAPEEWLPQEDITVTEVTGTAKLNEAGELVSTECTVSYEYGSASIVTTVSVSVNTKEITVKAPANPESYREVEEAPAVWMIESAYGFMQYADTYSVTILDAMVTQAGGFAVSSQSYLDSYNVDDYRCKVETRLHVEDYSPGGQNEDYTVEETFIDGKYTHQVDDERPTTSKNVTQDKMSQVLTHIICEHLFGLKSIETAEAYDMGSVYLFEFTGTEEAGMAMCNTVSEELFGKAGVLEELASAYETTKHDMYLSIDKYTGLPVAYGFEYTGTHTIYGQPCELIYQYYQDMDLASITAYKEISDELAPETEPENKATPLFYHVTGPEGQEMWLLGTIHIGDERTGFLPQEIYDAFEASDALALECDSKAFEELVEDDESVQEQVSELYYYSDHSTAQDHITTEDLYEDAVRMLKATGNYNYNSEMQKLNLWSNAIDNFHLRQEHKLSSDKGVEERLTKLAEEQDKPIREVESVLFQIGMMSNYSDNLQEFMLYGSLAGSTVDSWEDTRELYDLWCAGDEAALTEKIRENDPWEISEDDFDMEDLTEEEIQEVNDILARKDEINAELAKIQEEYYAAMESSRNAGMLEVAKEYLESGEVIFYAVGLAHLLAEDGLVATLREAGYTVELVQYAK